MIAQMRNHFLLLLMLVATTVCAQVPVNEIQAVLIKPATMCGEFAQVKQLVGIKKPLISNGRFCVVAGKAILWRTLKPFPATLRVTPDNITQLQNNQIMAQLDAQQEPVVRMINSVLFSLLAGDLSQLNKLFTITGRIHNKNWQVTLNAREPALAKVIGTITLQGNEYVRKVIMHEAGGDTTTISFTAMQQGSNVLTQEEEKLIEHSN